MNGASEFTFTVLMDTAMHALRSYLVDMQILRNTPAANLRLLLLLLLSLLLLLLLLLLCLT
jgi:hypothetical protein